MMGGRVAVVGILIWCLTVACATKPTKIDYHDALVKSLIFFEGQRSGKLPDFQNIKWRSDTGLNDGSTESIDLSGGYYDAGDNIKFGLPMAFTTTMLAWSVIEFGKRMPDEVDPAREAIRWGTDYLLKASSSLPNALYVQVGDPNTSHECWQRAEDLNKPQPIYKVTPEKPGSDVAGETAAALAASYIVFKKIDPDYAKKLIHSAKKAFEFADKYRGNYSDPLSSVVCPYYCSYSGYRDELLWAAAWLYKATNDTSYLNYAQSLNIEDDSDCFSWDNKLPGARVLLARYSEDKDHDVLPKMREKAEKYICSLLPNSPSVTVKYTPGGLMYKLSGSNLQYVTSSTFLLVTHIKSLESSGDRGNFNCGNLVVDSKLLKNHAKKQVDYILGDNPTKMSYMVGFGASFPKFIHHRGSSIPSLEQKSETIGCKDGFEFLSSTKPNPNLLIGAVVGGPDSDDHFADDRNKYEQSEPATYINAPLVGTLAYFANNSRAHP